MISNSLKSLFKSSMIASLSALVAVVALANGSHDAETGDIHFVPKLPKAPTTPSTRYSGNTPIDESNGIAMNSGTYGLRNPDYEAWASTSTFGVSLSDRPYSYAQKDRFIATLDERIRHFELAVWNYGRVNENISKPEGKAHAEKAAADLAPRIEKAREAWSKAKSANAGGWEAAQDEAKRSFVELQAFYYGMHKNTKR